jgi:hypothetical protein
MSSSFITIRISFVKVCNRDLEMLIPSGVGIIWDYLCGCTLAPASTIYAYGSLVMAFWWWPWGWFFTFTLAFTNGANKLTRWKGITSDP